MAGHMGDERVTIKKLRVVRTDPERNLLLVNGQPARRPRRADPREEGLTMPQTTLYDRTGKDRRQRRAQRRAVRRAGQRGRPPPGRDRPAGRPPDRHARHQDPRRGPRRRQEAVPPEGHRPRPPGHRQRAALPRRRRRLRAAPALLRAAAAAQDEAPRAPRRADRQVRRRGDQGHRHVRPRGDPDQGARRRPRARSTPTGRVLVVAPGRDETLELSARNLPTVEVILADSLNVVDLLKADLVLIEQPALARMEEVYA